jgi:predicted CopG family antitoxin
MNTTIAISPEIRDQIKEYGNKGETYDEILARILNSAKERQLQELLMDEKGTMTIAEARAKLNKK